MTETQLKSVPSLRFPEFNKKWKLTDVASILNRVATPVSVVKSKNYRQIGIRSHGKGIFHKPTVSGESLGSKRVFWVIEDALIINIVFAWEHAVAKTTKSEVGFIASHRFPMFTARVGISSIDYITRFFLTLKGKHLLGLASPGGAGRNKTLGQKTFLELKLSIPTLNEQQKIAEFLTTVDEKITKLSQKKQLLDKYKKGVMQKLFSQQVRFTEDSGNTYSKWEEKTLREITVFIRNGISRNQNLTDSGYKVTRIETISKGVVNIKKIGYVVTEGDMSGYKLEIGDILFSNINSVRHIGKTAYVEKEYDLYHGMNLLNIRTSKVFAISKFVYYYINQNSMKNYFEKICNQAVSQASINQSELQKIKIEIPQMEEQQKIADFLTVIDDKIDHVSQQLDQTKQFKKGLLQQMFI